LLGQAVDPELVAGVRADDGQAQVVGQLGRAARKHLTGTFRAEGLGLMVRWS